MQVECPSVNLGRQGLANLLLSLNGIERGLISIVNAADGDEGIAVDVCGDFANAAVGQAELNDVGMIADEVRFFRGEAPGGNRHAWADPEVATLVVRRK